MISGLYALPDVAATFLHRFMMRDFENGHLLQAHVCLRLFECTYGDFHLEVHSRTKGKLYMCPEFMDDVLKVMMICADEDAMRVAFRDTVLHFLGRQWIPILNVRHRYPDVFSIVPTYGEVQNRDRYSLLSRLEENFLFWCVNYLALRLGFSEPDQFDLFVSTRADCIQTRHVKKVRDWFGFQHQLFDFIV